MASRKLKSFVSLILAGAAAIGIWGGYELAAPYGDFKEPVILEFPRGMPTLRIAGRLAEQGVIRQPWQFLAVRALRPRAVLQAGEYRFDHPASVWEVFHRIVRGDVNFYEVTVPEGSNLFDIAGILEREGLMSAEGFRKAASDPSSIHDLSPQAPTLEGYLFPSTYRLTRNTTPEALVHEMTQEFRRTWKSLGTTADVHRVVTLASLVEKETGVAEERPLVASVFVNRLERGIPLDCDPTTIYAALIEGRFRGTIYRSDLKNPHPYNTYRNAGLPPGPIANPGLEALKAALHPAETEYLYFVAEPGSSGRHAFNKDLAAHERAVAEYRRGQKGEPETTPQRNPPARKPRRRR